MDKRKSFLNMSDWYNFNQLKDIYMWEIEARKEKNMLIDMAFGC